MWKEKKKERDNIYLHLVIYIYIYFGKYLVIYIYVLLIWPYLKMRPKQLPTSFILKAYPQGFIKKAYPQGPALLSFKKKRTCPALALMPNVGLSELRNSPSTYFIKLGSACNEVKLII